MKTIYYDFLSTSLGKMLLASDGDALLGAWFEGQRYEPRLDPSWERRRGLPILVRSGAELAEYFAGARTEFTVPLAPAGTEFQHEVWSAIAAIPYGETAAYRDLATRIGRPASIRAAGAATGRNPLSILVPCHRVVGADGTLTGYAGGLDRKRALLALERSAHDVRGAAAARRAA
jgi:methylated-DNA-[protein]-cysteine S-methyltransferase